MTIARRFAALVAATALGISLAFVPPVHAPALAGEPTPSGPYRMTLGDHSDFVSQATNTWCVAASMQMMLNIVGPENDSSVAKQESLIELARSYRSQTSQPSQPSTSNRPRGAPSSGWAAGLTKLGAGPYRVTSAATFEVAVEMIARAIRATGRPAGILVWKGAHAWVVSGFESTADPATTAFDVTGVVVMDPWYPRTSRIYGTSPSPGSSLTTAQLATEYLPINRPNRPSIYTGRFVVVIPFDLVRILDRFASPS